MKKLILIFLFYLPILCYSQLPKDIVSQHCYGTDEEDITEDIIETENAYYIISKTRIITGPNWGDHHNEILITKTSLTGQLIWNKTYGGSKNEYPTSITSDNEGYIYFGGNTTSIDGDVQSGNQGSWDAWIVKLDTAGTIIWEQTYGGSWDDYGGKIEYLSDGNIIAYAATSSPDGDVGTNYGSLDFWLWKVSPDNGEIIERKVFGNTTTNNIFDIKETSDGGFFFVAKAGDSGGMVEGIAQGNGDAWVVKTDVHFNIEWQKLIGGSGVDYGYQGIIELDDAYVFGVVTSSSDGDVHGYYLPQDFAILDIWIVKISKQGNIIWDIALGGDEWEHSSKIFQNQDGSFTVFGTTGSPNNGDVEGKHHTFQYPNSINKDIWMVHLSENGDVIGQRCFGNASDTKLSRGVIKKSDSHYLIAGTAASRQANPAEPEFPTDGEVWGGYTSTSWDIWFFEIKDCAQDTLAPEIPIGVDSICLPKEEASVYYTNINKPEYTTQWQLYPEIAGSLSFLQDTASVIWNPTFEGMANLYLNTTTDCGTSPYSETLEIYVFQPILNQAPAGPDTICSVNNQESYFTINNDIEPSLVSWQIEPESAGIIMTQQDTAIITWSMSYEGEVKLNTTTTNNCGTLEYSPNKTVQLKTCLGIGEQAYRSLKVYPNPAKDYIVFELPQNIKNPDSYRGLVISDIYGKTIAKLSIKGQTQIQWNCQEIASGVYFYQVEIGGVVYRGKVVVSE